MTTENTDKGQTPAEADSQGRCALAICSASVLRDFNAWRRDECDFIEPPHSANRIGEAIDDAVKSLAPWQTRETAPQNRTRVLATHVGVYEPTTGSISGGRFFPDGGSGSEPFTHWMLLPDLPNSDSRTPRSISDRATDTP